MPVNPRASVRMLALILMILFACSAASAAAAPEWVWRHPLPQGRPLFAVTYGGGQFVAVGPWGSILTSSDGINWMRRTAPDRAAVLDGVAYGDGTFVAVGRTGERGVIFRSTDGVTWTEAASGERWTPVGITYGNGRFVVLQGAGSEARGQWRYGPSRAAGTSLVSTDGLRWEEASDGAPGGLREITFGNGRFVAVGSTALGGDEHGEGLILTSSDGLSWKRQQPGVPGFLQGVAFGGGRFLAVAEQGAQLASDDGAAWSIQASGQGGTLNAVAYGDGRFVTVGQATGRREMHAVAYGGGRFVAVGEGGAILSSSDGVSWTLQTRGNPYDHSKVAYGNGLFVAAGWSLLISDDGAAWREVGMPADWNLVDIAFGSGLFVAVGTENGRALVATSSDGLNWAAGPAPEGAAFYGITYGGGTFIAWQQWGPNWSSADGRTWVRGEDWSGMTVFDMAYGRRQFLAVGALGDPSGWGKGAVLASADGKRWSLQAGYGGRTLEHLAYGNGTFVAGGPTGNVGISRDGAVWEELTGLAADAVHGVAYGNGQFAVAYDGVVLLLDARRQVHRTGPGYLTGVRGVGYGKGAFVAVGEAGLVLTSSLCGTAFPDVTGEHPACGAIGELVERKVAGGYPDGLFRPGSRITRAEFAKLLVLMLGKRPDPQGEMPFADAMGHWAAAGGFLQTARALQAINGFPGGEFRPDAPLTRAELVKIVAAANGLTPAEQQGAYTDVAGEWFADWAAAAHEARLVGPDSAYPLWTEGSFRGNEPATRAEAAMVLANLLLWGR